MKPLAPGLRQEFTVVEAEASAWTTTFIKPVGYNCMGDGRFAFLCSSRQPEDLLHVLSSLINPVLDLGQNPFLGP